MVLAIVSTIFALQVIDARAAASDCLRDAFLLPLRMNFTPLRDPLALDLPPIHSNTYSAPISVGSPAQTFDVLLDTGSSRVWVPSSECSWPACQSHRRYHANLSSESRPSNILPWFVTTKYGTGDLTANFVQDQLCLQGKFSESRRGDRSCAHYDFMAAQQESDFPFKDLPFDGILGLSPMSFLFDGLGFALKFSSFALRLGGRTVHKDVKERGSETDGEIAFFRCSLHSFQQALPGTASKQTMWWQDQPWTWASMPSDALERGYWLVRIISVMIEGGPTLQNCSLDADSSVDGCRGVIDSGSGFIVGPETAIEMFNQAVQIPSECSDENLKLLPNIRFNIERSDGGIISLVMEPSDYTDRFMPKCSAAVSSDSTPTGGGIVWVLGSPLLRRYLTAFDPPQSVSDPGYIGFAPNCWRNWQEGCPDSMLKAANVPSPEHAAATSFESMHLDDTSELSVRAGFSVSSERRVRLRGKSSRYDHMSID